MEIQLKHRILGAIITVIALAIALPVVLDQTRHLEALPSNVPSMPEIPDWAVVENKEQIRQEARELYDGTAAQKMIKKDPVVVTKNEPADSKVAGNRGGFDENNIPYAWVVQLGAFKDRANANQLVQELRQKGYKTFTDEFPLEGLVRVYVGPEIQREKIEKLQQKLQKDLKQKDIHIKRWQPGK